MITARALRFLAVVNVALGVLFAVSVFPFLLAAFSRDAWSEIGRDAATVFMSAFVGGIALIRAGWIHIRYPSRKSALNLAANIAVLILGIILGTVRTPAFRDPYDIYIKITAIVVAYVCYRGVLRPVAIRQFTE